MDRPDCFSMQVFDLWRQCLARLISVQGSGTHTILLHSLADPDDPLDRMTNVLRWWFSKDLKYISGKLIKPYNSILGETFNCAWEVPEPQNDGTAQAYTESDAKGKVLVKCLNEQVSDEHIERNAETQENVKV